MKITEEEKLGNYRLLKVDGMIPSFYSYVVINGVRYDPVLSHNLDNYVAIESNESHLGQDLQFVFTAKMKDG